MRSRKNIYNFIAVTSLIFLLALFIAPDYAEARGRRGGSFGRSRSSFGRKSSRSRTSTKRRAPKMTPKAQRTARKKTPSFGGNRIRSSEARKRYGTPRKTVRKTGKNSTGGGYQNYRYHSYSGYGSGLMTGYMMGSFSSRMMWMPWSGYYWYTRPYYSHSIPDNTKITWHVSGGKIKGPSDEPSVEIVWGPEGEGLVTVVLNSRSGGTQKTEMKVKVLPKGSTPAKLAENEEEVVNEEVEEATISGPKEAVSGNSQIYTTGTIDVYPPTFNWSKSIMTILVIVIVLYILKRLLFRKKKRPQVYSNSSFG